MQDSNNKGNYSARRRSTGDASRRASSASSRTARSTSASHARREGAQQPRTRVSAREESRASESRRSSGDTREVRRSGVSRGASTRTASASRNGESGRGAARQAQIETAFEKSRNVPALDGIRCLAVLGVIFYHMDFAFAQGGLLGVTVFFVLSGYLITNLLLIELDNTRTINLLNFWFRRLRRLLPAILFALAGTAVLCTIFNHALLTKMRGDLLPSLFFFNNWWQIFHDVSYFEALGSPSPITHYWSLAIEEQFYLIWPPVLLLLFKFGTKKSHIRNGALIVAAVSALAMAIMFDPAQDPSRVYYGTDTRAFSLLIGAALAFTRPTRANDDLTQGESLLPPLVLEAVGFVALFALIIMMGVCDGFSAFIYRGGLVLCSLLTAVVIYVSVHPNTIFTRILGFKGFVFIGKLSYSMYLWHFPVLLIMNPSSGSPTWYMCLLELVVIAGLSWVSFKFVEDPIRHGAIGRVLGMVRNGEISLQGWVRDHLVYVASLGVVAVVAVGGLALVPDTVAMNNADALKEQSEQNAAQREELEAAAAADANSVSAYGMVAIGDSVLATAQIYEPNAFPNQYIDAEVSRRLEDGQAIFVKYRDMGIVGKVVVFALGTNGYLTEEGLESLIKECGDREIFFVNTRSPYEYTDENNMVLNTVIARHPNCHLVDWAAASLGRDELFDGDGTHPGPEGAALYMSLIHKEIDPFMPADAYVVKPAEEPTEQAAG